MDEYSEDFASFARDFLNPDLGEDERVAALKAAIHACMDEGEGEGAEEEAAEKKPAAGLALVFGGPKKKKG